MNGTILGLIFLRLVFKLVFNRFTLMLVAGGIALVTLILLGEAAVNAITGALGITF